MSETKESGEVLFLSSNATDWHPLDNFASFPVTIWGETFNTAEHAFQWRKFALVNKAEIAAAIAAADTPVVAKEIAKNHKDERAPDWSEIKVAVMEEILRAKLHQNDAVKKTLLETAGKRLYENNPGDPFWGTGPHGDGKNMMGELWTKLREELLVST